MAELRERCEQQVDELELLQSVFGQPGEFTLGDEAAIVQVKAFLQDLTPSPPPSLSCTVSLALSQEGTTSMLMVDIDCRLTQDYPNVYPEVCIRSNTLPRAEQDRLNEDLHEYIKTSVAHGEVCLLSVVEWVRENALSYNTQPSSSDVPSQAGSNEDDDRFCRMWLYMHHIYSKTKRRNILSIAPELDLTGFCLPGKPGVVCVEGDVRRTKEFYSTLRRWNWKSITCRKKEIVAADVLTERKFEGFCELDLETHGPRSNHMNMGQFRDYLQKHGLEYMFKELFGIE